jgi:hypothetical protein
MSITDVDTTAAIAAPPGIQYPSMPRDVSDAKSPPAGVKAPYAHDWNAAAKEPRWNLAALGSKSRGAEEPHRLRSQHVQTRAT